MPPAFFCTLCQKGYARSNELEAHENSYDHQHKKRLKEMKQMTRPTAFGAPRKKDNDVMSSNIQAPPSEKKGGGFKPIGGGAAVPVAPAASADEGRARGQAGKKESEKDEFVHREGPIPWEELDAVGELVDLERDRPREMAKVVEAMREHMKVRRDPRLYEEIWKKVGTIDGLRGSESPPRAMGLGA